MTTNYERIKNMTLKEMLKFLDEVTENPCINFCGGIAKCGYKHRCSYYINKWLSQKCEEQ